jgi:hypothetical protein
VSGSGTPATGRVVNLEVRTEQGKDAPVEHRLLTIASDAGAIRILELTPAVHIQLLDPELDRQLGQYLDVLGSERSRQVRHVTFEDTGTGTREVRVSYISEVPVWKSTYRIVFAPAAGAAKPGLDETAILQGWAVVDNTVGADWDNVQLSLVAGAPQSFVQPLSQPYYTRRPEIGLPTSAMLAPQTHESGTESEPPPPPAPGLAGMAGVSESVTVQADAAQAAPMEGRAYAARKGLGSGTGSGFGHGVSGGVMGGIGIGPAQPQDETNSSTASAFDDYFEYTLSQPVTLHRNQSALVPVLQTNVQAERVTLWSEAHPEPLRALWLTNASKLTLDRGSFSIFEAGEFAGEGLLDPVHPGEKRLLSYAVDEAVHIHNDGGPGSTRIQQISVHKGLLFELDKDTGEQTYVVHNAAAEPRSIIVEHPVRPDWKLTSEVKPVETTGSAYRFRVIAAPGETVSLHVAEERSRGTSFQLVQTNDEQLRFLFDRGGADSARVQAALAPVISARARLSEIETQLKAKQQQIDRVTEDQKRLSASLAALKSSPEERALAKRYASESNADEDQLQSLTRDRSALEQQRATAQQALSAAIDGLEVDLTL